ncbi:MAG: TolC family protein [Microscillaceae bacterium]|jgi:cobalt-zinc-cadmium efflux system outer membrane protein|nr:TolC family protein [Microscillaceae bacterium]
MKKTLNLLCCLFFSCALFSQNLTLDTLNINPMRYQRFINLALENNLNLLAEEYNVSIADAQISLAKIRPNPSFTMGNVSGDITNQALQQQLYAGFTQTVEMGKKRRNRIQLAESNSGLAQANFEILLRNFRLEATQAYVQLLIHQNIFDREKRTYTLLSKELEEKEKSKDMDELELLRLKIEMGQLLDDLYESEADVATSALALALPLSQIQNQRIVAQGNINIPYQTYAIDSLTQLALQIRPEMQVARLREKINEQGLAMVKSNRVSDLTFDLGNNYYTLATNEIGPTPAYHAITATVGFPLMLSNRRKGDLVAAQKSIQQAQTLVQATAIMIETEIRQAYLLYQIAHKQIQLFLNEGLLAQADRVLSREAQSYAKGETSFLDLSESHRKADEVYFAYFDALKNYIDALIALEHAVGFWDIDF